MANVKHLYTGHGDPNDNPELELSGDAIGNHLYQDLDDHTQVWMSVFEEDGGQFYHVGWQPLFKRVDMSLPDVETNYPDFEGQIGYKSSGDALHIAMRNNGAGGGLMWRSMGTTLGAWFVP